ncbi:hypothetical protein PV378_44755, partial [Streptomyces scabiei]|nr:hypothetical protein [Streptomyces scabiei]
IRAPHYFSFLALPARQMCIRGRGLPDPTSADEHRLDSLVAAARPAHMPYTVQVTAAERIPER